jgi:hypothetical protein
MTITTLISWPVTMINFNPNSRQPAGAGPLTGDDAPVSDLSHTYGAGYDLTGPCMMVSGCIVRNHFTPELLDNGEERKHKISVYALQLHVRPGAPDGLAGGRDTDAEVCTGAERSGVADETPAQGPQARPVVHARELNRPRARLLNKAAIGSSIRLLSSQHGRSSSNNSSALHRGSYNSNFNSSDCNT